MLVTVLRNQYGLCTVHFMTKPNSESRPEAILAVRLPAELRDSLKVEAEAHQRSMSGQVRWLIERSLTHDGDGSPDLGADDMNRQAAA